jgi:uncharacterized membrane protein YgcG
MAYMKELKAAISEGDLLACLLQGLDRLSQYLTIQNLLTHRDLTTNSLPTDHHGVQTQQTINKMSF